MQSKLERPIAQYSPYFYYDQPTIAANRRREGGVACENVLDRISKQCFLSRRTASLQTMSSDSSADTDGPPETKRFRIDVDTQIGLDGPSVSTNAPPVGGEASQDGQSPAAPSSASYRSSNSSVISSSESPSKVEDVDGGQDDSEDIGMDMNDVSAGSIVNNSEIFEMLNKTFGGVFNCDLEGMMRPNVLLHRSSPPTPVASVVPGAIAVAQSPAAQLFSGDDWSWHRNPAASIRSGGTNKQTPVWKYFVYNKTENLSRCIVGDCTYMLKGPHTSTLACHLKKHTREYSEFQKLKTEYSRTKLDQVPKIPDGAPHPLTLHTQNNGVRQAGSPASSTCNTNTNTSSSASSGSASGPSSASNSSASATMDLSMKKPKKEPSSAKLNEIFLNGLRQVSSNNSNGSPPTTPQNPPQLPNVPSFVTNMMLQMNPLHMMLAQSLPGATPPAAPSNGLNALQQAGLTLAANGQIIQSKKWRNDDKKQKELLSKLSLALATSHVTVEVLQNPLWKEVFEMAQPKFTLPTVSQYENLINSTGQKLIQSVKAQLSSNKKLNLLLDVTKVTGDISRVTVSVAMTGGAGNSYETQVILLAFRNVNGADDLNSVFEKVLEDYGISQSSINRVICSGLSELEGLEGPAEIPKQMEAFSSRLADCFHLWLESSTSLDILKKNIYSMLLSYLTVPTAIQIATQMLKSKFELPVTEPFPVIVEKLMAHRDIYQMKLDGLVPISDREWSKVNGIHSLMNIFKPFMSYSTDMTTVDTIIPTYMQIRNVLEKDLYQLGEIGADLLASLNLTVSPIMNPDHEHFDPTYIQATALNPQLAVTLTSEQMTIAKTLIESEISKRTKKMKKVQSEKKLAMGVDSLLANVMRKGDDGGACDAMTIYGDLFQSITGNNSSESKENIVTQYFDEISSSNSVESMFMLRTFGNPMQAPLSYWKACSSRCSELSDLATELLSIPIFTLTADRVLSFSPNTNSMNTNLILSNLDNSDQFEKQLLLRFNRQIVSKLFN